jgi:hypothetical protein
MSQVIPFILHQTWKSKDMPTGMKNATNSWKNLNSDYKHIFYDDNDVTNYVNNFDCDGFKFDKNKLQTAFNKIKSGAGKADIFRYLVMYNTGGVYADADTVCLKPITQYLNPQDYTFITGNDSQRYLHQWFFLCTPKHPFIKETLENSIRCVITETPISIFKNPNVNQFDYRRNNIELYTGPFVMDYSIKKLIKMSLKDSYRHGTQIVNIQNKNYKVHFHKDHFEKEFLQFKYSNYTNEIKNLNLKYWMDEPLFIKNNQL